MNPTEKVDQLAIRITQGAVARAHRLARSHVGAEKSIHVKVVEGPQEPVLRGKTYYWTTLSGKTRVYHPNAYG